MLNYIRRTPITKVAVTGSSGRVGRTVKEGLEGAGYDVIPLDLPETDVSILPALIEATEGTDAIIHCAWKDLIENVQNNTIDPVNNLMTANVYGAAVANGIRRVIMTSSNHAHAHDIRDGDGKIRITTRPEGVPNNPYGAEKLFMENLGRHFAKEYGLEVICWRIGNLNDEDRPKPSSPENPQRWLSKRDLGRLAVACLSAEEVPDNFQNLYAVSRQEVFDWANVFGYEPLDGAD
ncbi:NAD(P)-dependent oxidoreductase [Candidatus Saccharibacteria bacterium]|nr:NAD(P)-dependent oxidoreductase [Candidatus Saccharibacteria bacterium]